MNVAPVIFLYITVAKARDDCYGDSNSLRNSFDKPPLVLHFFDYKQRTLRFFRRYYSRKRDYFDKLRKIKIRLGMFSILKGYRSLFQYMPLSHS